MVKYIICKHDLVDRKTNKNVFTKGKKYKYEMKKGYIVIMNDLGNEYFMRYNKEYYNYYFG